MKRAWKVSIFVGSGKTKDGKDVNWFTEKTAMELGQRLLCANFGGATLYYHTGSWLGPLGSAVSENGFTLVSFTEKTTEATKAAVQAIADELRNQLNQDCALVSIEESQIEFV